MPRIQVHHQYHNLSDFDRGRIIAFKILNFLKDKSPVVLILLQRLKCLYVECGMKKAEEYAEDQLVNVNEPQNVRIDSLSN